MLNILVFPCGSEIGLEIHSALSPIKDINLFGASTVPDHGRFTYDQYCDSVDHVASDNFLTSIKAVVERFNIDYIYPAHDSVLYALSKFAGDLPCGLIAPSEEVSHICRVKSRTYKTFSDADFIPAVYQSPEDVDSYPIFAKPDVGQGSVGISIIQDKEQFSKFLDKEEPYVFCEYLPGEEFTVDCVSDAHGKLLYYGARVRARIRNGISVNTRTASAVDDEVVKIAEVLNERLKIKGAWFFQVKRASCGALKLLEVAPRVAGSMSTNRAKGVNFPLLSIYAHEGLPLSIVHNDYLVEVDRALNRKYSIDISYSNVYIDFDDTITKGGGVNTDAMKYMYQCRNNGISLSLITRHAKNLVKTMDNLAIPTSLFHEIIHITDGTPKSDYISEVDSIFIDDSFAERSEVKRKLGIPCFDVDGISVLLGSIE